MADLFAWVVKEEDGREGVIGAFLPGMGSAAIQLVGAYRQVAEAFEPIARRHADATGKPVRLVRFTEAETLKRL